MQDIKHKDEIHSLHESCADRRAGRRAVTPKSLRCRVGPGPQYIPLVECTNSGARVIIKGDKARGDRLCLRLESPSQVLECEAKVAWVEPLHNGRSVVGLEFLSVRRSIQ